MYLKLLEGYVYTQLAHRSCDSQEGHHDYPTLVDWQVPRNMESLHGDPYLEDIPNDTAFIGTLVASVVYQKRL